MSGLVGKLAADALYDMCSAAQHADQATIGNTWARRDAEVLSGVASLLASWAVRTVEARRLGRAIELSIASVGDFRAR